MKLDPKNPSSGNRLTVRARWALAATLTVPFVLYFYTCAPGIGMGDTALLVDYVHFCHLSTHAAIHNIAILIGWVFYQLPVPNPAWKVNLASVFTGGAAVVLYGLLLSRVLRSRLVALACTGVLMVSHSMWWHSTIAEAYAVNAVLTIGALWILFAPGEAKERRLLLLFAVAALALFNHAQMGIIAVGATVSLLIAMFGILLGRGTSRGPRPSVISRARRAVTLGALCTLSFLVGRIPWLLVFAKEGSRVGLDSALYKTKGAGFQKVMLEGGVIDGATDVLYLMFENFPGPFLLAVVPGMVILARRYGARQVWAFFAMLILNTIFFGLYATWDRYAFLLPSFIMLAFAGSLAVDALWCRLRPDDPAPAGKSSHKLAYGVLTAALLFSILFPPWFYSRLSVWGKQPGFWSQRYGNSRSGNLFDFGEYRANPNKRHWRDTEEFADLLFAKLPPGAIYIDDDSRTYFPVEYFRRFFRARPDLEVELLNTWGMSGWGLSRTGFRVKVGNAYRGNRELFIPVLGPPYRGFLPRRTGSRRPTFQRFVLDDRHHIYRLRTAQEFGKP